METTSSDKYVEVGGDFAEIFDQATLLSMLNSHDEAAVALKFHLIMEEFINIWCSKRTYTDDLFAGIDFVPFKTKLAIARNLGLEIGISKALDKLNTARNRYSHRLKYNMAANDVESLSALIDNAAPEHPVNSCSSFVIESSGIDPQGRLAKQTHSWNSGNPKKLFIMCVTLTMKTTLWIQKEFDDRGISYTLTTGLPKNINLS